MPETILTTDLLVPTADAIVPTIDAIAWDFGATPIDRPGQTPTIGDGPLSSLLLTCRAVTGAQLTVPMPGDARWNTVLPGGCDTLSCTLVWPTSTPVHVPSLEPLAFVEVVDRRSAQIVWHGRITDPGQRVDASAGGAGSGQTVFQLVATGEKTIVSGTAKPVMMVDRDLSHWTDLGDFQGGSISTVAVDDLTDHPQDFLNVVPSQALQIGFAKGTVLFGGVASTSRSRHSVGYWPALLAEGAEGPTIVRVRGSHATFPVMNMATQLVGSPTAAPTSQTLYLDDLWDTADTQADWSFDMSDPLTRFLILRWFRQSTTPEAGFDQEVGFVRLANVAVLGGRVRADGTAVPVTQHGQVVTPADIIADTLGRFGLFNTLEWGRDLAAPDAPYIGQACWWEGITASGLLDFAAGQCDGWWAVSTPGATGRPVFRFGRWDDQPVRYAIPGRVSRPDLSGGADELFNEALVSYTRADGAVATTIITQVVPVLERAGLLRRTTVDLTGQGALSDVQAMNLGRAALRARVQWRASGTVRVMGPVLDLVRARLVQPWEIEPGWHVHLMDVDQVTTKSAAGWEQQDQDAVYRCTGVTYDAAGGEAELSLDGGARTLVGRPSIPSWVGADAAGIASGGKGGVPGQGGAPRGPGRAGRPR